MPTIETEQGLLIPRETLEQLGEWVVEEQTKRIVIRPKTAAERTYGMLGSLPPGVAEALSAAIESGELDELEHASDDEMAARLSR